MKKSVSSSMQVLVTYGDEQDYGQMVEALSVKGYAIKSTFQKDYVHAVFIDLKDKIVFDANVVCASAFISCGQQRYMWRDAISRLNNVLV